MMMGTPARLLLFVGGVFIAIFNNLGSAQPTANSEILIPVYQFPSYAEDSIWVGLNTASQEGHPITGILNPFNGPNANEDSTNAYKAILKDLLKKGDDVDVQNEHLTLVCYVYTLQGTRDVTEVENDINGYDQIYPGVCDGIFFDQSPATDLTDENGLTALGSTMKGYNDLVYAKTVNGKNKISIFNPGTGADPVYLGWDGAPGLATFENFYSIVRKVGVPRPPATGNRAQKVLLVHTAAELADVDNGDALVKAMLEKAACSGWGKLYFTDDDFNDPPLWNDLATFWDTLVAEVSEPVSITCPDAGDSRLRIMVPLLPSSSSTASDLDALMDPILANLSPADYGDVVSVVVDAREDPMLSKAAELRDAGARVLCYMDANGLLETNSLVTLINGEYSAAGDEVCGGYYVANLDTANIDDQDIIDFYINTQFKVQGCTVVFQPLPTVAPEANYFLYTTDWGQKSFQGGRVIVATVADGAGGGTVPGAPDTSDPRTRINSAVMMTGFSGEDPACPIDEMAAGMFGYAYVTEADNFATLSTHWDAIVAETESPSNPTNCDDPPGPTPTPTVTACGDDEPVPAMSWSNRARKVTVTGTGCADMTRVQAFLLGEGLDDVLVEVGHGVWQLDATIEARTGTTLKFIGQGMGECDELRLITNTKRSRLFGQGGDIDIEGTKVLGWNGGAVDEVASKQRGYIYCNSCSGSHGQCTMKVKDSTIGYLGSNGVTTSGLAWKDLCSPSAVAAVTNVIVTGNKRGLYARGVNLEMVNVVISGSSNEGIRIQDCSGSIKMCAVDQSSSSWAIYTQSSDNIEIIDNVTTGLRGLFLKNGDSPHVLRNTFDRSSSTSARVRTTNTDYQDNLYGDGVYPSDTSDSRTGLRVQRDGCFGPDSGSGEQNVQEYITQWQCQ